VEEEEEEEEEVEVYSLVFLSSSVNYCRRFLVEPENTFSGALVGKLLRKGSGHKCSFSAPLRKTFHNKARNPDA
jgi:hypothetical protein